MKNVFFFIIYFIIFSKCYAQSLEIFSVVDNKGNLKKIDNSKWTASGEAIYNKNAGTVIIGEDAGSVNTNAALQIIASDKGVLIPKVALTQLSSSAPFQNLNATTDESILVYNTVSINDVTPGFYYWDKTTWKSMNASNTMAIKTVSTAYTANFSDYTIVCDATNGAFTLTLPAANSCIGKVYVIRKFDETTNNILFSPVLKFSGSTSISNLNHIKTLRVQSDGSSWYVLD